MPATEPLPTIESLLSAFHAEAKSRRRYADGHRGSIYDHCAGIGAMLFVRQGARDRQLFRSVYFDTAEGSAMDLLAETKHAQPRQQASVSSGTVEVTRVTSGAGTFRKGTRIAVTRGGQDPLRYYQLTAETPWLTGDTRHVLDVESVATGAGQDIQDDANTMYFADPLSDSWTIQRLRTSGGMDRQTSEDLRASIRDAAIDARPGYPERILSGMRAAGASEVALFASDFLGAGVDYGLNRIYVGDANFSSSTALLLACRLALPTLGIEGTNAQVLAMADTPLTLEISIQLWETPDRTDHGATRRIAADAVVEYFKTRENPFIWQESGVRGAILRAVRGIQEITITPSASAPTLASMFDTIPLPRYSVAGRNSIQVTLAGPS